MDKTLGLGTGRSGVRILGRGKCSLRTIAVNARVNNLLYLFSGGFQSVKPVQESFQSP